MPLFFSASFIIKLKIGQYKAEEKLEDSNLQILVLDQNEFRWLKKNKEISIGGKLFDLKSFSENNGQYIFKGIFDNDEIDLTQSFSEDLNESLENQLPGIFQLLLSVYSLSSGESSITSNEITVYYPLILPYISSPFQDILTPPPQLVLT